MAVTREEVNVNKMYGQECILKKEEFMEKYHVKENGLTSSEAQEKINKYERNTTEVSRKNIIYSRGIDNINTDKKEVIVNQKKNLYTFMKKERKKEPNYSHDMISEEKMEYQNKSYR